VSENQPAEAIKPQSPEEIFVTFYYTEVKDLAKHFLTLISATLVLTITFTDKIVPLASASAAQRLLLLASWLLFLLSLGLAGIGLFRIFLAAEKAKGSHVFDYADDFQTLARKAYRCLDLGAVAYGFGLILFAAVGATRLFPI
jgi:hypothetical protein